jgi:hypothetical protein
MATRRAVAVTQRMDSMVTLVTLSPRDFFPTVLPRVLCLRPRVSASRAPSLAHGRTGHPRRAGAGLGNYVFHVSPLHLLARWSHPADTARGV